MVVVIVVPVTSYGEGEFRLILKYHRSQSNLVGVWTAPTSMQHGDVMPSSSYGKKAMKAIYNTATQSVSCNVQFVLPAFFARAESTT